jgi:hypothetical protein
MVSFSVIISSEVANALPVVAYGVFLEVSLALASSSLEAHFFLASPKSAEKTLA